MVTVGKRDPNLFDVSFMPSYRCNLSCKFCMYEGGPKKHKKLDMVKTAVFINTIYTHLINAFGLYGGEPSIALADYDTLLNMLPDTENHIPRFVITNGSWSTDERKADEFLNWANARRVNVFVSGMPEHKKHQDANFLRLCCALYTWVDLKDPEDKLLAMGRLKGKETTCTEKCKKYDKPLRFAVCPSGDIIFQSCDGVYPKIGTYYNTFQEIAMAARSMREKGCK